MKKIVFLLILIIGIIYFSTNNLVAFQKMENIEINSPNAIVLNEKDQVLYKKKSQERIAPASLTKLMTAIIVSENVHQFSKKIEIDSQVVDYLTSQNAMQAGFRAGEKVSITDLMYGLLLPSGAEAAISLANFVGGNEQEFVRMMNEKVEAMGLENTVFKNATGLDAKGQYTTAEDMATILKYAWKNNTIRTIMSTNEYVTANKKLRLESTAFALLQSPIKEYLGGKTGTTLQAGHCLASVIKKDKVTYYIITMGGKENQPYKDLKQIYKGFK